MKNKAVVPIGTIAIIIVVLLIAVGMWWFLVRDQCGQYGDVTAMEYRDDTAYTHDDYPAINPEWVMIGHEADGSWRFGFHPNTADPTSEAYQTNYGFDELPKAMKIKFQGDGTDRYSIAMHIWNAIDKGCV